MQLEQAERIFPGKRDIQGVFSGQSFGFACGRVRVRRTSTDQDPNWAGVPPLMGSATRWR